MFPSRGKGYEAGVRYVDPNITVILTYHPGDLSIAFIDPAWGKQTPLAQIGQKADVIFGAGGETGNGALVAAAEKGVCCIGVDVDQMRRPTLLVIDTINGFFEASYEELTS